VIELANQIFGFNGWSSSVVDITPDYIEESNKGRFTVGVTAVVKVMLKDGTFHEDVGFGMSEHPKKGSAIENAKKEAVSDARKRALRLFGNALGNCLYDKQHLQVLKKVNKGAKGFLPEVPVNSFMEKTAKQFDTSNVNNDQTEELPQAQQTQNVPSARPQSLPIRGSFSATANRMLPPGGFNAHAAARANFGNPESQPLSGNTISQEPNYSDFAYDAELIANMEQVEAQVPGYTDIGQKRTLNEAFPPAPTMFPANGQETMPPTPSLATDKRARLV